MKLLLLSLFILAAASAEAQVIFGFVPHQKVNDWKLTSVTFGSSPNTNRVLNGRGTNNLVIDVNAIRHPEKVYNYSELAARIYAPAPTFLPAAARVPYFLLMPPPTIKIPERGRRNTGC